MAHALFLLIPTFAIAGQFTASLVGPSPYIVSAITTDSAGNTYVVGSRALGGDLHAAIISGLIVANPATGITTTVLTGGYDVFVAKIDPTGKVLFTDTFAGKGIDLGSAIALDGGGNIYIAGSTTSPDFPLSAALQTQPNPAYGTGFIIKLSNDGTSILYSTYFGGQLGGTFINALATDSQGNLYLTGTTTALDFPHTAGMPFGQVSQSALQTTGAIMASISAAGDKILYSGVFAGTSLECTTVGGLCSGDPRLTSGTGISVDPAGNAYMAANTNNTNLPTTAGVLAPAGVGAFVAKITPPGSVSYATYLCSTTAIPGDGTTPYPAGQSVAAIAVDAAGNAYLGGFTDDPNFPTTPGSFQDIPNGPPFTGNGFLSKLNPAGAAMVWSTLLGGVPNMSSVTSVQSMAVDASGNVWASGGTNSSTFPNANGWIPGSEFLVGLNAAGSKLTYSALYPTGTVAQAIALDPAGVIHAAGTNGALSTIAPTTAPQAEIFALQSGAGGSTVARVSPAEVIAIYGPGIGPQSATNAAPVNGFYPSTIAQVQVTINGANVPLLYVSSNQINAVLPMELAPNAAATIRVINGTNVTPDYPVWIAPFEPLAFPTLFNQDRTANSAINPAHSGSVVTFYATGWQSNFSPLADGQVATTMQDSCLGACQLTAQSDPHPPSATLLYGGAAPGSVAGVSQFNLSLGPIPASLGSFLFEFSLTGSSTVTQSVWVAP